MSPFVPLGGDELDSPARGIKRRVHPDFSPIERKALGVQEDGRQRLGRPPVFVEPVTGGASKINVYGAIEGASVYRPNALTGDPNHLGIELVLPLLILTPLYLRLEQGHRLRTPLAALLGFLLVVELATLSRSGLLGLGCGALVLLFPYRRHLRRPAFLVPLGAVVFRLVLVLVFVFVFVLVFVLVFVFVFVFVLVFALALVFALSLPSPTSVAGHVKGGHSAAQSPVQVLVPLSWVSSVKR